MSFELFFRRKRSDTQVVTLYEADGNGLTLNADDEVRFKIYRRNQATPALDIDSVGALTGGSVITITQTASAAQVEILIAQGDTSDLEGVYSAELSVVDSADGNKIKHCEDGQVTILPSAAGDIGLT